MYQIRPLLSVHTLPSKVEMKSDTTCSRSQTTSLYVLSCYVRVCVADFVTVGSPICICSCCVMIDYSRKEGRQHLLVLWAFHYWLFLIGTSAQSRSHVIQNQPNNYTNSNKRTLSQAKGTKAPKSSTR